MPHERVSGRPPSDKSLFYKTGLFFPENWPLGSGTVRHHSFASISDGLSRTIMLAENRWAGYDPAAAINWSNPAPWRTSFFISGYVCLNNQCKSGNVDWRRANDRSNATSREEAINGRTSASEGSSPWPLRAIPAA